jgi:hypothetical protein
MYIMTDNIDLNINNYNSEEYLDILGLEDHYNLTKNTILDRTDYLINKYKNNTKYKNFFEKMKEIFERILKTYKKDEIYDPDNSNATKILKEQYLESDENDNTGRYKNRISTMVDDTHMTIGKNRLNIPQMYNVPFYQGNKNPTYRATIERVVNFDSTYREIMNPISTACANEIGTNKTKRLDLPTDFTVNLDQPLLNVLDLTLLSLELPQSWYVFSSDYGTNYFSYSIDGINNNKFDISNGNYNGNTLVKELNDTSKRLKVPLIFSYKESQHKISIKNNGEKKITIEWASNLYVAENCYGGASGQKVDYNLGWLLGFREVKTEIIKKGNIIGEALLDIHGPKYFLLSLEDFNNNKPNQDLISLKPTKDSYKLPSYYNDTTMKEGVCAPKVFEKKACMPIPYNVDLSSNLTKKQKYTVDQIKLAMRGNIVDRYNSPNTTDILARISIMRDTTKPFGSLIFMNNLVGKFTRQYFGPVNLKKFAVRLYNDKGMLVNLNGMDWSFSINVTQMYQY